VTRTGSWRRRGKNGRFVASRASEKRPAEGGRDHLASQLDWAAGAAQLTSTKRGATNSSQMFRTVRVALALLSIFSIAYVLITPAATDDVTAVSQRSHFGIAQKLAVCLVQPLAPQIAIFRLPSPSSSNQRLTTLELVDLFRTFRC
jgi:hypothetical protein